MATPGIATPEEEFVDAVVVLFAVVVPLSVLPGVAFPFLLDKNSRAQGELRAFSTWPFTLVTIVEAIDDAMCDNEPRVGRECPALGAAILGLLVATAAGELLERVECCACPCPGSGD